MNKKKVITLLIISIIGFISSLELVAKLFDSKIPLINSLCHIGDIFNCEIAILSNWANLFGFPQSILNISIFTSLLLFFGVALIFLKEEQYLSFLVFPFIISIFNVVYSGFSLYFMYIASNKPYDLYTTIIAIVNIVIIAILIIPYLQSLTDALKNIIKTKIKTNIYIWIPLPIIILTIIQSIIIINIYNKPFTTIASQSNISNSNNQTEFVIENYLSEKVFEIDTTNSPKKGSNELGVSIIKFENFICPACRRASPEIDKLFKHYEGKIEIIFKHYPLESKCFPVEIPDVNKNSCDAAYASMAAYEQGKFWEYYDILHTSDPIRDTSILEIYAKKLNLDIEKFRNDYNSDKIKNYIKRDTQEGYEKLEITSIPTLYFNGRRYTGSREFENLKKVVDYFISNN